MIMSCIVVDDEPALVELIASYAAQTPALKLIYQTTRPLEAVERVLAEPIDLVFLDVEMAECSGIEFIEKVQGRTHIILCTGYAQYALDGFEQDVIDFLLKPIGYERFARAVEKAQKTISAGKLARERDHIFIAAAASNKNTKINFSEMDYIRSFRNYTAFYCKGEKIISRINIGEVERLLPQSKFLRVQISYIIPIGNVKSFDRRLIQLHSTNHEVPIGGTYKGTVLRVLRQSEDGATPI
jgi:two-component system, LytTR family, response regulator